MTEPGRERLPEAVPTPVPGPSSAPDLAAISTDEELRVAVLALLGNSYDRAVENRTGLSKTTVNDLRNGRRRLTVKTLTVIVSTYDSARSEAWLAAWHKLRTGGSSPVARHDAATAGHADHLDSTDFTDSADARSRWVRWRSLRLAVGSALVAAVATAAVAVLVFANGNADLLSASDADDSAAWSGDVRVGGAPGLVPGPPPYGPGGPGAAAPVGGPGPPPADIAPPPAGPGSSSDSGAVSPRGCYGMPLPTVADVVEQPGAASSGVHLTAASYSYFEAWSPSVAVGGQLSGRPPEGRLVVGAAWADPATADSTPELNPGNGRFYPGNVLELTGQSCFTVPPYNIGYGGYSGITTRVYVLLVDALSADDLPQQAHQLAGLTEVDLERWDVDVLGYFVVPSPVWSED